MKKCIHCGAQIADDSRICSECGKEIVCPHCGSSVGEGDACCQNCGKSLNEAPSSEPITYAEKQPKSGFKKYLPYIFGGILLLGIIGYFSSKSSNNGSDNHSLVADSATVAVTDSVTVAVAVADEDKEKNTEEEIQAKKHFIETFYKGMENSNDNNAFVKKHVTPKVLKILKDEYEYECDNGDCLATWLFSSEGGLDLGTMVSRTVNMKDENNFLIVTKYEYGEYEVRLSLVNDGDSYKIDDIEKVRSVIKD